MNKTMAILDYETVFEMLCERGIICHYDSVLLSFLDKLEKEGLALRCDKIDHHPNAMNPCYAYVTNDDRGRNLALQNIY